MVALAVLVEVEAQAVVRAEVAAVAAVPAEGPASLGAQAAVAAAILVPEVEVVADESARAQLAARRWG